MSIKSLLMPPISQRLLSRERLLARRARAERDRRRRGEPHRVYYFHQLDDPYSLLTAAALPRLRERYDIEIVPRLVQPPADSAAPERNKLIAYSRYDTQLLAQRHGLGFVDPGRQPAAAELGRMQARCLAAISAGHFVDAAAEMSAALWTSSVPTMEAAAVSGPSDGAVEQHLAESEQLRTRLGHYLGATFYYAGEWYWGIDRLHHLESRLQELGAAHAGVQGLLYPPAQDLVHPVTLLNPPAIHFFVSLRSPYSAIVTPRVFELGRLTGAKVLIRYVLPMVMRGLPVPASKRKYISLDTAREAHHYQIPFGRINDPVGRPTERGLAVLALAERLGRGPEFLRTFMHGVWAEGIDAGSDRGLRRLAERAGLGWDDARLALADDQWRAVAETNRAELLGLGLWGVPSFCVAGKAFWGQDRLWAVQDVLLGTAGELQR